MKVNIDNLNAVLNKFELFIRSQDKEYQNILLSDLDDFFEDLANDDAFGTEGQFDPRGDQR